MRLAKRQIALTYPAERLAKVMDRLYGYLAGWSRVLSSMLLG